MSPSIRASFFGARPTLELRFVGPGFGERRENFNSKERGRWVELSCSTRLAGRVIVQSLLKILRGTDVNYSGSKSKEVDDTRTLRRGPLALAQSHSTRFGY